MNEFLKSHWPSVRIKEMDELEQTKQQIILESQARQKLSKHVFLADWEQANTASLGTVVIIVEIKMIHYLLAIQKTIESTLNKKLTQSFGICKNIQVLIWLICQLRVLFIRQ